MNSEGVKVKRLQTATEYFIFGRRRGGPSSASVENAIIYRSQSGFQPSLLHYTEERRRGEFEIMHEMTFFSEKLHEVKISEGPIKLSKLLLSKKFFLRKDSEGRALTNLH
jgi:hypothetical protein